MLKTAVFLTILLKVQILNTNVHFIFYSHTGKELKGLFRSEVQKNMFSSLMIAKIYCQVDTSWTFCAELSSR